MRRARLKVQATVPIRRKLQENLKTEAETSSNANNSTSDTDKPPISNSSLNELNSVETEKSISISNLNVENNVSTEKSPISISSLNSAKPDENTEKCLEKRCETEKSTDSVVQTDDNSINKSSVPINSTKVELHNLKQEIVENQSVVVNQEKNNLENVNPEINEQCNLASDARVESEKQVEAASDKDDNIDKNQSDQDIQESSHVEGIFIF